MISDDNNKWTVYADNCYLGLATMTGLLPHPSGALLEKFIGSELLNEAKT